MAKKKKIVMKMKKSSRASGSGASSKARGRSASRASSSPGPKADEQPGAVGPRAPSPKQSRRKAAGGAAPSPAAPSKSEVVRLNVVGYKGIPHVIQADWLLFSEHAAAVVLRKHGLTVKQSRFILYFLTLAGGNASQAAVLAGYKETTARQIAYENLMKPYMRDALREVCLEILGAVDDLLTNKCLEAATLAKTRFETRVTEITEIDAEGKETVVGRTRVTIEGGDDYKAQVMFLEKLKALGEGRATDGVGEGMQPVMIMGYTVAEVPDEEREAYKGYSPPLKAKKKGKGNL